MIFNQVAQGRGTNNKKNDRHRSSANNNCSGNMLLQTNLIFRRQKTASVIDVPNEVENNKDDPKRPTIFLSLKKIHTNDMNDFDDDDDDIVSVTSKSTNALTSSLVPITRRVRMSSQRRNNNDILTIPHVPNLFIPFDNKHNENNVDIDDTTSDIIPIHLPVRVRSTLNNTKDDDNENSDRYLLETALAFDLDDDDTVVCSSDDATSNSFSECYW